MLFPAEGGPLARAIPLAGRVQPNGAFEVNNVPPGRYFIRATSRGARRANDPLFASQEISVDGRDVSDITLILTPGAEVEGHLVFEGNTQPQPGQIRVTAQSLDPFARGPFGGSASARVNEDGTFVLTGWGPAGPRLIRPAGLPDGWALKAVYFDGRDVIDTGVDVGGVQRASGLQVVLTDRVSNLSGAVHDAQGQPLTEFTVVAFPTDSTLWRPRSRHIQASRPDQNGQFQIRGVPPGDYLLAAVDAVQQGEWFDPVFLDRLRNGATRVSVREGETKAVNLSMDVQPR